MPKNKYQREIKPGVFVDVYDVLKAFNVVCPAMAHGVKKCLAPGQRGVKNSAQDKNEAISSIKRSIEMEGAPLHEIDVTACENCCQAYESRESGCPFCQHINAPNDPAESALIDMLKQDLSEANELRKIACDLVKRFESGELIATVTNKKINDLESLIGPTKDVFAGVFEGKEIYTSVGAKNVIEYLQGEIKYLRNLDR